MRVRSCSLGVLAVLWLSHPGAVADGGQQAASQPSAAHVYHLTAFRAAPGRLPELLKLLNTPQPGTTRGSDFAVILRHREGQDWDLLSIEHMGERATISAQAGPPAQAGAQPDTPMSQVAAWHGDTYAAGPPLEEFRRAMGLQAGAPPSTTLPVYVVSVYTAAPGHRGQLQQQLAETAKTTPGRAVTLTHIEGAPWTFLQITRYDSWMKFAEEQQAEDEKARGSAAGPNALGMREHAAVHNDTLAVLAGVLAPQ